MVVAGVIKVVSGCLSKSWYPDTSAGCGCTDRVGWFGRGGADALALPGVVVVTTAQGAGEALIRVFRHGGTTEEKLLFFLVDARFLAYEFHPVASVFLILGLQMKVLGRGEEAENMLAAAFGVFEVGYCGQVGEINLFVEAFFGNVFVDGEEVRAEDEVEFLPLLYFAFLVRDLEYVGILIITFVFRVRL